MQFIDLLVFNLEDFPEAIQFDCEAMVLTVHVFLQVSDLVVVDLLKVISYSANFLVFLIQHRQKIVSTLLHHSLQPGNLIVLLFADLLVSLIRLIVRRSEVLHLLA